MMVKEKKNWTPWQDAKPLPLEDTYTFNAVVRLELNHQLQRAIMRWLNATYPEQHAKEVEAFNRQERGESLFATAEEELNSRNSELVKAHHNFRRFTQFSVEMEVLKDGSVRLLGMNK